MDQELRRGWPLLAASGVGLFLSTGVLLLYPIGVFLPAIVRETGWSAVLVSGAVAPAALAIGLLSPLVGVAGDRFGPRRVLIVSAIALGAGLMGIGLLAHSPAAYFALVLIAAVLGCAQTPVPYSQLITGWFDRKRGTALGAAFMFTGAGIAFVPVIASMLIDSFGWRASFMLFGAAVIALNLPAALFVLRDPPEIAQAAPEDRPGLLFGSAARTSHFWILFLAFLLNALAATAGSIMLPTILQAQAIDPRTAALSMMSVGFAHVVGRLFFGILLDRMSALLLTSLAFTLPAFAYAILWSSDGIGPAIAAGVLLGLSLGAEGDALSYILSRAFGMRAFGRIFGFFFLVYALGTGLGPALMTWLQVQSGDYQLPFTVLALLAIVGGALPLLLLRRPYPHAVATAADGDGSAR